MVRVALKGERVVDSYVVVDVTKNLPKCFLCVRYKMKVARFGFVVLLCVLHISPRLTYNGHDMMTEWHMGNGDDDNVCCFSAKMASFILWNDIHTYIHTGSLSCESRYTNTVRVEKHFVLLVALLLLSYFILSSYSKEIARFKLETLIVCYTMYIFMHHWSEGWKHYGEETRKIPVKYLSHKRLVLDDTSRQQW